MAQRADTRELLMRENWSRVRKGNVDIRPKLRIESEKLFFAVNHTTQVQVVTTFRTGKSPDSALKRGRRICIRGALFFQLFRTRFIAENLSGQPLTFQLHELYLLNFYFFYFPTCEPSP